MANSLDLRFEPGGLHLPELGLWLDAHARQTGPEMVFISHAHADHIRSHREVLFTEATACFVHQRLKGQRNEHRLAFHESKDYSLGSKPFRITLLPAGHILGSAMAFIEAQGTSLLYTGDFKLKPGLTAETCFPQKADILVMESTFGRPHYRFPDRDTLRNQTIAFCRQALQDSASPVLVAYSLGKSQELLRFLEGCDFPILLQEQAFDLTRIYKRFGHSFPHYEKLPRQAPANHVQICAPIGLRARLKDQAPAIRSAFFSGWAIDINCRFRTGTDAAFPLSDHADYQELIDFVKQVAPKQIFTLHGFAADLANSLRELGFNAFALSEPDQLSLPLH